MVFDKDICTTHIVIQSGRVRASGWLLVVIVHPALFRNHRIIFSVAVPFSHWNRITQRISVFVRVSSGSAIFRLVYLAIWHVSCIFSRLYDVTDDLFLPVTWWCSRSDDLMKRALTLFFNLAYIYKSKWRNVAEDLEVLAAPLWETRISQSCRIFGITKAKNRRGKT